MTSRTHSQPPDEPFNIAEPLLQSPASPKPIHLPTPSNIPVLEMQMDVGFNQTELHMSDPAMHNTEIRPDAWRDPDDEPATQLEAPEPSNVAIPFGEASEDDRALVSEHVDHSGVSATSQALAQDISSVNDASIQPTHGQPHATETSVPHLTPADVVNVHATPSLDHAVDVQSLLNTLGQSTNNTHAATPTSIPEDLTTSTHQVPTTHDQPSSDAASAQVGSDPHSLSLSTQGLSAPPTGLPPRPPPQEQPLIHPNYVHSQHIRDYHPHAANPAVQTHARSGSQSAVTDSSAQTHVPPVHSPTAPSLLSVLSAGGLSIPGQTPAQTQTSPTSPSSAVRDAGITQYPPGTTGTPIESRRESKIAAGETPSAEDRPWDAETQRKYDRFIEEERKYVSEGRWEQFPAGSRLFVGNLSSEKVTKRDIFHVFQRYGDLAQISIKQAYGFVQFFRAEDCTRAMEAEQGTQIREKKIHLEVSKPQKNRNSGANNGRRSRSPDVSRVGKGTDRYVSGRGPPARGSNNRSSGGYGRSPSPPPSRGGYRDRYSDRYRDRSPERYGRRYRSPSPRRHDHADGDDDDLPLPRRARQDVPDVQIIALDSLDRDFISWVEKAFSSRGVRVDVLLLSPRLSEQAVIRRQIVEGVIAVSKLTRRNQDLATMGLQIFDRSGGANNVKFEEYDNLAPTICAELVLRARSTTAAPAYGAAGGGRGGTMHAAPPSAPAPAGYGPPYHVPPPQPYGSGFAPPAAPTPYGMPPPAPPHGYPQPPPSMPAPNAPPNLQNLITSLDPNGLQNLLSAMNQNQPPHAAPNYASTPGSGYSPSPAGLGNQQNSQALAGFLQQQQQPVPPIGQTPMRSNNSTTPSQVNMQDILSRLGTYKQ